MTNITRDKELTATKKGDGKRNTGVPLSTIAATAAPLRLTTDEIAVLTHFRDMDDRSQAFMLRLMPSQAEDCPRRPGPKLRLVVGGVK